MPYHYVLLTLTYSSTSIPSYSECSPGYNSIQIHLVLQWVYLQGTVMFLVKQLRNTLAIFVIKQKKSITFFIIPIEKRTPKTIDKTSFTLESQLILE